MGGRPNLHGGVVDEPKALWWSAHVHRPDFGLRFPGQFYHWETALNQNWMRDYDPTTRRCVQADPLGLVDGASVYGYALQSPARFTDPTGEFIPQLIGGILRAGIEYLTNPCATAKDTAIAGALCAVGGGGLESTVFRARREVSHSGNRQTMVAQSQQKDGEQEHFGRPEQGT
ncbi:RHS repeat-associated core domain-containing protein [Pseudaestuariivita sp.]|uniref:RHS repeat-associated core domain-containing protein n=1 Tax=Pseudaestuariivita sp. TaxID=2211669 RepID=UPI004059035F